MTARSTDAAAAIPRAPLWAISRYHAEGEAVEVPVSWSDIARDASFAQRMLARLGVARGDTVLVVGTGDDAIWTHPVERAVTALGAVSALTFGHDFDAFRGAMFLRRLRVRAVVGLNGAVVSGLRRGGYDLSELLAPVPILLARPDCHDDLRADGLQPLTLAYLGPALAIECPQRSGAHVDGAEWRVGAEDGRLHVTTVGPRAHASARAPTGLRGSIVETPCACGIAGPRVIIHP